MPYIMVGFTSKRLLTKQVDICLLVEFFCFMPVYVWKKWQNLEGIFLTQINSRIVWNHTISRSMDLKTALLWTCNCNKHVTGLIWAFTMCILFVVPEAYDVGLNASVSTQWGCYLITRHSSCSQRFHTHASHLSQSQGELIAQIPGFSLKIM